MDTAKVLIEVGDQWENTPATHAWYRDFYQTYKADFPNTYTVGEIFGAGSSVVKSYTGDQLDQVFNFEMSSGFLNSASGGASSGINSALRFAQTDMPDFNYATFLTNHDQNRVMSVLDGEMGKAKVAAFLLLTSPGTPFLYYEEEIGMQGHKPDEDIRLPMQWSGRENAGFSGSKPWRGPEAGYKQVNVEAQTNDPDSLLSHYCDLIAIRNNHLALSSGDISILETGNPGVYRAIRKKGNAVVLLRANLTNKGLSDLNLTGSDINLKDGQYSIKVLFGGQVTLDLIVESGNINSNQPIKTLPAYSMYILLLQP